jgi:thiol-disulfide isomerase/thioredoxin
MTGLNKSSCRPIVVLGVGFMCLVSAAVLAAPQAGADASPADAASDQAAPEESKKTFVVPETDDVKELFRFLQDLEQHMGENRPSTQAQLSEYRGYLESLKTVAERIVKLKSDKSTEAYQKAEGILLQFRMGEVLGAPAAEQRSFLEQIAKRLESDPGNLANVGLAARLAQLFEQTGNTELAMLANQRFGPLLATNENEKIARFGRRMEATARRLGLVGNPMRLTGTTMEGKPFDWESYRGRIVLVDFWATWCGPCRAELPNVLKNYETYHDRGFDVVGVSVDEDREALEEFLNESPLPWTTLHEEGGQHPEAAYYGISAIPTTILVGRDGKVISLAARGPELSRLLEKLIGPAEPAPAEATSANAPG